MPTSVLRDILNLFRSIRCVPSAGRTENIVRNRQYHANNPLSASGGDKMTIIAFVVVLGYTQSKKTMYFQFFLLAYISDAVEKK